MFDSRYEIVGWILAILLVTAMGVLVFTGPFHKISQSAAAPSRRPTGPMINAKIVTDPNTVGRYVPKVITLKKGQPVRFANVSNFAHTVTARDYSFDSRDIGTQHSWTFQPRKAGTFKFYCVYHPLMTGVLIVK